MASHLLEALRQLKPKFPPKRLLLHPYPYLSTFSAASDQKRQEIPIKSIKDIPGPRSLPLVGTLWTLPWQLATQNKDKKPMETFILYGQHEAVKVFGRILSVSMPGIGTMVVISDPKAMAKIYANEAKYPKRFNDSAFDYVRELKNRNPGVFFANGPHWYKHRSVISKRMLRPKEVADYVPVFNEIVSDFVTRMSKIRGPVGSEYENEIQDLANELFKWSFESVAHVMFEKRFRCLDDRMNPEAQDFIYSVQGFLSGFLRIFFFPVWFYKLYETKNFKEFSKHYDNIYNWVEIFIDRKLKEQEKEGMVGNAGEKRADFFQFLLSSGKISKDDILDSVVDLLFGGVDTTSNTMLWVLYMMGTHQDKQEKLHREVSSVLSPGDPPTAREIANMPYLKAWVRETLRLYPLVSNQSRVLHEGIDVMGYHLPAETLVSFQAFFMSRDEKTFKDAAEFKPERWLRDENNKMSEDIEAFASIPFGFGTRMCVGRRIAEMEIHLLLAQIVQRFVVEYPHNERIEPFLRGITIPDRPVRVTFVDRLEA